MSNPLQALNQDKLRYGFEEYSLQEDLEQILMSMKLFSRLLEHSDSSINEPFCTASLAYTLNFYAEQIYHAMEKARYLEEGSEPTDHVTN